MVDPKRFGDRPGALASLKPAAGFLALVVGQLGLAPQLHAPLPAIAVPMAPEPASGLTAAEEAFLAAYERDFGWWEAAEMRAFMGAFGPLAEERRTKREPNA